MISQEEALALLDSTLAGVIECNEVLEEARNRYIAACVEAHEAGISDQKIHERTKGTPQEFSRARIQQFRASARVAA